MTLSRRSLLAAGATGTIALTAGCLGFVLGNEPLTFDSDRVAPTDEALGDAGYEEQSVKEDSIERSEEVAGIERDFKASFWRSVYTKKVEYMGQKREGAAFAAVSIPGMEVAGRSLNPLDDMSNERLLERFLNQIETDQGAIKNITHQDSFDLEILGGGRTVDTFLGESELEGETIDIEIKVTSFSHEGDMLVLLGLLPKMLTEESANVEVLMESAEHPV
ncbi:DUF6517 family protein [Natrinema halophilum]|uniref:Uncharacterized protein n=1 Tax=Natrinema halophilum TaxID=1699371 RepID=A0A7D5GGK1_9EURY|nr:DUF6517 family protein [Natrinema halophilum]QLG48347.1 DUF6517 family protein [Natrinema halophilum]